MSWHMSPRYGHGILVSGYPVLTAVNWPYCECPILKSYIKDVDLPRHAWDTPPFLLIVSPTLPVQSVDAYVRTYARSVTWQPNEKRLTIFYEYGALSHARFVLRGSPFRRRYYMQTISKYNILLFSSSYSGSFISHFLQIFCLVSTQYSKFLWKGTQFRAIFQVAKRGDSIFDHFYVNYPVSSLKTLNN